MDLILLIDYLLEENNKLKLIISNLLNTNTTNTNNTNTTNTESDFSICFH
jgi:hypothetical protein